MDNAVTSDLSTVRFYPGDGTEQFIEVKYISDFARGGDGLCAFCHGDPCAEEANAADTPIGQFFARNPRAETCPLCGGRPS